MRHLLIKIQPGQEQSLEQVLGQKLPLSDYDITKVSPKKLILNLLKKKDKNGYLIYVKLF